MAVKQNNTETNGPPSGVNGNANTSTGASLKTNLQNGTGGGATAKKNLSNSKHDGGSSSSEQQPGCSGAIGPSKQKSPNITVPPSSNGGANSPAQGKPKDLKYILQFIEFLEFNHQLEFGQDILKIYQQIIVELARVPSPRQSEDLKRFKEDITKVSAFFAKAGEKRVYLFYLGIVCQLMTQTSSDPPSCAVAIIFQLFNDDMVYETVSSLLSHKVPDHNIRRTVRLLSEWLCRCNFCQNLNLWIMAILNGLQEQQKFDLLHEIALENIEQLFASLTIPVLRPKVAPIVFHMLSTLTQSPNVFHKILPKLGRVLLFLKQQTKANEDYAEDTKIVLQKLVDISSALMVRFYGYDNLYEPVELALKEFQPSFNYLNSINRSNFRDEDIANNDEMLQATNAKVGLVNLGNTCYMNSVLQALAMTKEFSREILLLESKSQLLIKMQQQIALMLYSMRYELTPSRVLNATRPPGFSPGIQQDSSEFLGYLLDVLHEQEVAFRKKITIISDRSAEIATPRAMKSPHNYTGESVNFTEDDTTIFGNESQQKGANLIDTKIYNGICRGTNNQHNLLSTSFTTTASMLSIIEKTFTGKLSTTYKCLTCGWKSYNVDSFRDLQLSFPEVKNDCVSNYSVQDLIDYYCSQEKLYGDNQYFCEKCRQHSDGERFINIISAPKNLILTLKHFKYDQKYHMRAKLMHKVFHDEKVTVKVFSAETREEEVTVHYDLYAGVVHSGFSMDSGHYYTYAADGSNKWYKFNDNIVTNSKSEELHNLTPPNTPYILFYQMSARSNENLETAASTKVMKVDIPAPLKLEDLPRELRDYVHHDNCAYTEELKLRRFRNSKSNNIHDSMKFKNNSRYDADDDQPPPGNGGGCGENVMNMNINRFVY